MIPSSQTPAIAFIVGMPRAATTWLCKCLNEHPDAAAFGESLYWGRLFVEPRADGTYGPEAVDAILARQGPGGAIREVAGGGPGSLRHVTVEGFDALIREACSDLGAAGVTPGDLFTRIASAIGRAEGARVVIEKTPHHLNWIDRIDAAIPGARYIVMVREPYGFMLSYKHQGDRGAEVRQRRFRLRYHPVACALVWRTSMRAALAAERSLGDRALLVRQETLSDADAVLERVQRFLGLEPRPIADLVPRDNTSFPAGSRPDLAPEDVFWMNRVAGRFIGLGGYERRRAGLAPMRIAWSALRLPVWAVQNVVSMRRITHGSIASYLWRWVRGGAPS